MPNPGATACLSPFPRETVNVLLQVPDYVLRKTVSVQQREALVVEAFIAFEEMFYLLLSWQSEAASRPMLQLSSRGTSRHKLMLDLLVQCPQLTYGSGGGVGSIGWRPERCPCEVGRPISVIPLVAKQEPNHHSDANISLEQTVTFAITGTVWELGYCPTSSLQCRSFREQAQHSCIKGQPEVASRMIESIASTLTSASQDVPADLALVPDADSDEEGPPVDDDGRGTDDRAGSGCERAAAAALAAEARPSAAGRRAGAARAAHSFILQAQSPVFRGMLAAPMSEASERRVRMAGVRPAELDDLLTAVYGFGVPAAAQEDEPRLLSLLSLADRYGIVAIRDESAALLEPRITEANMTAFLQVADRHQTEGLRSAVLGFIAQRLERVAVAMDTDDRAVRRSLREYLDDAELAHSARVDAKAGEATLMV